ncbi:MAG: DUF4838 domain-containing protein [Bacteroidales bacterium]|nr:DUF4838 domain-containing protein [Bacteroidales bacterium]
MRKLIVILSIVVFLFSCSTTGKVKDLTFYKNGKTEYHIIISEKATDNEIFAAKHLQQAIYKISGAKIPIVNHCRTTHNKEIHIGNTENYNSKKSNKNKTFAVGNGFTVLHKGNSLYFNGKDDVQTMYAVIDFTEKYLKVRHYAKDCSYYPVDSALCLKNFNSYSYSPINTYRNVNSMFVRKDNTLKRLLKLNTTDDMFANGYFVHTILKFVPPQDFFDSHPEYFALINDQRNRRQVCWTNEDVYQLVKENLSEAMITQPDKKVWSVSQEDNDIVCRCSRCQYLIDKHKSDAAPIIYFVNRLAKEFPDKTISTLAYRFSRKCPENISLENNVQIMLCSIECDRNKTIEEQGNVSGTFAYDLTQWGKVTKNIFLWDYECDFDYYLSPFPNLHTLQPNIQFFVKNNAFQHFQQANCDAGHEFSELKNYLIATLLWNPDINFDSTVTEFCENYYGKAGRYIKKYIDDIERIAIENKDLISLDIYGSPVKLKDNLLTKENLDKWMQWFDTAQSAVKQDSIYLIRVKTALLSLQYAVMEIAKTDMYGSDGWFEMTDGKWSVKKDMAQMLEDFHSVTTQIGMSDINEKGLTPEEYYLSTKRMLDADLSANAAFHKKVSADIMPSDLYSDGRLRTLTDGVKGSDDYKLLWLGWWGEDFVLNLDLEQSVKNKTVTISSLNKPASWILHPLSVECETSTDNKNWTSAGKLNADGNNRNNPVIKEFTFKPEGNFRYIRFKIEGTKTLPAWHHCYKEKSWVFLDEIIVK